MICNTYLHEAAKHGDIQTVKLILLEGNNVDYVNAGNSTSTTALHYAIEASNLEIVKLLLTHGADPNIQENLYDHTAFHARNIEFIKLLLTYVANPNIQNRYCSTPFHYAAHCYDIATIRLLLKNGANLNVLDNTYSTPFMDAYRMFMTNQAQNKEVMQLLVAEIVKLEHIDVKISEDDLEGLNLNKRFISESDPLKKLEQQCHKGIEEMQSISIGQNDLSFFDIFVLKKDIKVLARCANNPDVKKYQHKFLMYSYFIEESIGDGQARANLLQRGVESMDEIFESNQDAFQESQTSWLHLPSELKLMILENLGNNDLTKLQHHEKAVANAEAELRGAYAIYEDE